MTTTNQNNTATIYHIDDTDEHLRVWIDFENNTIDEPRSISNSQTAWTMREHHGYAGDYRMGCQGITADDWADLLDEICPLVQQIHDISEEVWDGSNYRFSGEQEGHELKERLETLISEYEPTTTIEVWDGGEWVGSSAHYHDNDEGDFTRVEFDGEDIAITPDTTDEELKTLASNFETCADGHQVVIGVYEALDKLRDDCRENAE